MDQEVKTKWLQALRSGDYEQGQFNLRRLDKYCCLGVLCDIVDPAGWDEYGEHHRGEPTHPNDDLLHDVGLPESLPVVIDGEEEEENFAIATLVNLNDKYDKNFSEIADWIEAKL